MPLCAVKAFVTFSLGHPTATTELHGALPGWLAGMIDVLSCPSHDHIPQIEANCCILFIKTDFEDFTRTV